MKSKLGLALIAVLMTVGCGAEPLHIWKVSLIEGSKPATCYKDGKITDRKSTSTSIETYAGEWEIYQAAGDTYSLRLVGVLGTGSRVLAGAKKGDGYTFDGLETVRDITDGTYDAPKTTISTSTGETVTLVLNGDTFTGKWVHTLTKRCEGSCSPTYNADFPDCTVEDSLKGTRVPVQNYHAE